MEITFISTLVCQQNNTETTERMLQMNLVFRVHSDLALFHKALKDELEKEKQRHLLLSGYVRAWVAATLCAVGGRVQRVNTEKVQSRFSFSPLLSSLFLQIPHPP